MTPSLLPTSRTFTERRGAVVSRTVTDGGTTMFFEITVLRRHDQKNPTFQGTVVLRGGRWHAEGATAGRPPVLVGTFADFVDAENTLVARRTGIISAQPWNGPRPKAPHRPTCRTCGWPLTADGACTHLHLHW